MGRLPREGRFAEFIRTRKTSGELAIRLAGESLSLPNDSAITGSSLGRGGRTQLKSFHPETLFFSSPARDCVL